MQTEAFSFLDYRILFNGNLNNMDFNNNFNNIKLIILNVI